MKNITVIEKIEAELESILTIPFAKENVTYKPTLRQPWCRGTFMPTESFEISIGQDRILRTIAIYQLDVFTLPTVGTSDSMVDDIIDHLNSTRFLYDGSESITLERAWRLPSITNTDWYQTPIQIRLVYYRS